MKRINKEMQLELDEINAENDELIHKYEKEIRKWEMGGAFNHFGGWRGRIRIRNLEAKIAVLRRRKL